MNPIVEVEGVERSFGDTHALCGIDLAVPEGSVVALLGPNGAGKTTLVRILSTLIPPDDGTARIAGFDVVKQPTAVRRVIGLAGQNAAVDDTLTGRENLEMIGRLSRLSKRAGKGTRAGSARAGVADRCGRSSTQDVFGWHAPAHRPRRRPGRRTRECSCSTNRPPASIPRTGSTSGRTCASSSRKGRASCSPRSTSRRPTNSPARSWSSTTARSSSRAPRSSSSAGSPATSSTSPSPTPRRWRTRARALEGVGDARSDVRSTPPTDCRCPRTTVRPPSSKRCDDSTTPVCGSSTLPSVDRHSTTCSSRSPDTPRRSTVTTRETEEVAQ